MSSGLPAALGNRRAVGESGPLNGRNGSGTAGPAVLTTARCPNCWEHTLAINDNCSEVHRRRPSASGVESIHLPKGDREWIVANPDVIHMIIGQPVGNWRLSGTPNSPKGTFLTGRLVLERTGCDSTRAIGESVESDIEFLPRPRR